MKHKQESKNLNHLIFFILFFFMLGELQSFHIRNYSDKDGLSMNIGLSVIQDKYSYIWIATQQGLNRFNGAHFKIFNMEDGLPDNYINHLFIDSEKNLWVATRGGLSIYNHKEERFESYIKEKDNLSHNHIRWIEETKNHEILIGTEGGLSVLRGEKIIDYSKKHALLKSRIYNIAVDKQNDKIYLGTLGQGLIIFQNEKVEQIKKPQKGKIQSDIGLPSNNITALLLEKNEILWIGTDAGLSLFQKGKFIKTFTKNEGLSCNGINTLYRDRDGKLWIGTQDGLNLKIEDQFLLYDVSYGLAGNNILSLCEDHEGGFWIGLYGGISYLGKSKFKTYSTKDGLPENNCFGIHEFRNGKLWIATFGGITEVKEQGQNNVIVKTYTTNNSKLPSNIVRFFDEDTEGNIWIATYAGGLVKYKDNEFTSFTIKNGLPTNNVRFVYVDKKNCLWLGMQNGGLVLFDKFKGTVKKVFNSKNKDKMPHKGLLNDNVRFIKEDSKGNLWIGLDEGLSKFKDGNFFHYTEQEGLVCKDTTGFFEDEEKKGYWITTFGNGIYFLNESLKPGKRLKHFSTENGLPDNCIYGVVEDDEGWLWLPTNKGVCRWDRKNKFVTYTTDHGLPSNENNSHSGFKDSRGRIWFSTPKGVACIDIKEIPNNEIAPPVYIESLKVNNKEVKINQQPLIFRHNHNNVFLKFTALSYQFPEGVKFKIRLDGFHKKKEWTQPLEKNRSVEYTNLPPGEYNFRVKACNNDGKWNEKGAHLNFTINPSFFQTLWFYLILGSLIFILFSVFLQYRMAQQKEKEKLLQRQYYQDKMVSLGEMAAALAHEMNNPANYIYGNSDILHDYIHAIKSILIEFLSLNLSGNHKINRLRKELRIDEKLKELDGLVKYIKEGAMRIAQIVNDLQYFVGKNDGEPHPVDIHKSITTTLNLLRHKSKDRVNIRTKFGNIQQVEGYGGQLNQVFMNVLANAIYALKDSKGTITVATSKKDDEHILIKISDTGEGIPKENLTRIFEPFFTTKPVDKGMGLGLFTTKKIIDEHNGYIEVKSKLDKGTHFCITLPIKQRKKKVQISEGDEKKWEILATSTKS